MMKAQCGMACMKEPNGAATSSSCKSVTRKNIADPGLGASQHNSQAFPNRGWPLGRAGRPPDSPPADPSSEFHAVPMTSPVTGQFMLDCDRSHLQIADESFTLV